MILLQEQELLLRTMEDAEQDYLQLLAWLSDERVAHFYGGIGQRQTLQRIVEKYRPRIRGEHGVTPCIVQYEGDPLGYLQFCPVDAEEYDCRELVDFSAYQRPMAVDLFFGKPEYWGRGLGSRLLRALCRFLWREQGADAVFIDPKVGNERAIRCYQKAGFIPLGIVPRREEMDGRRWDNLILRWQAEESP